MKWTGILNRKIIAILRGVRSQEVETIGKELLEAGINAIEVPLNSPDPFDSVAILAKAYGTDALIGAGTVLTTEQVAQVSEAGGKLVVSPDCKPSVIAATKEAGMQSWPGVMTPSECFAALDAGADGLKFFPAELIGPKGVKAMRAVLPADTEVFAVGGAHAGNFGDWIAAGATGFGIGSALYTPGLSAKAVRERADKIVAAYDRAVAQ